MTKHFKLILATAVLILFGCGDYRQVEIDHTTQAKIDSLCDEVYRCAAYATWTDFDSCTIYIKPMAEYHSEDEYNRLLGHELRHCFEGEFH